MTVLMFRYRLYPSRKQITKLEDQFELCRQTHNWLLASCKGTYEETGKTLTQFDLNKNLMCLKNQRPEITNVHSQVLQNLSKRIKDGYTNFFARRKTGLRAGLPRFKKHGTYKSITYPQSGFKDVGIDVGLNSYAVLSDGTRFENPRFYRKSEKRITHLQRGLSRKKNGSNNRNKARLKVARLHEHVQNQRTDFLHKASRKIVDTYEMVYVEDLKIGNMVKNHCLAKSISDAGWGRFIGMIAYKAESAGGRLVQVNPRNTTQNCSQCGELVKKSLSDRTHDCPFCGLVMDRDLNASKNILKIGKELAESMPVEDKATTPPPEVMQVYPVKQEASLQVGR